MDAVRGDETGADRLARDAGGAGATHTHTHAGPSEGEAHDDVRPARELLRRWPDARPFVLVGSISIVAGGLVAAVTRPSGIEEGSWVAAYLVLVGGVAQIVLGGGRAFLSTRDTSFSAWPMLWGWNLGALLTISGTIGATPTLTSAGGLATAAALVLFLRDVRGVDAAAASTTPWLPRASVLAKVYRVLIYVVLASVPIGLVMAWARHG